MKDRLGKEERDMLYLKYPEDKPFVPPGPAQR